MASTLVLSLVGFLTVYISLWLIILFTHDENEPPLNKAKFPFADPLIQLIKEEPKFYAQQRQVRSPPVYESHLSNHRKSYEAHDIFFLFETDH